jgi:hypothetical protein
VSEHAFEDYASGLPDDVLIGSLGQPLGGIPLGSRACIALFGGEYRGAEPGSLDAPAFLATEHVHRIGGSE